METFATIEREGRTITVSESALASGIVEKVFSTGWPLDEKEFWCSVWDKLTQEQKDRLEFIIWNESRLLKEIDGTESE